MTTAAIVQARVGSTRLPGKVLERLGGATVLTEVLRRCQAAPGIDVVCCAAPDDADNDVIEEDALRAGSVVFRGAESDVLGRYVGAARLVEADIVLRVTSDCPLIDPEVCGAVAALVRDERFDYAANNMPPSWPHGLDCEALTMDWLQRAADEADAAAEREHVTPYIRRHPDARRANLLCPDAGVSGHRWTLDTSEDLHRIRRIFAKLPAGAGCSAYRTSLACADDDGGAAADGRAGVYLPERLDHDVVQFSWSDERGYTLLKVGS
ncbi:MAG: glycosyltransferase family protein [Rhodospirillales bacterium]|nr:glycosyltransferase family protein [Rhodospirillales bacterium]